MTFEPLLQESLQLGIEATESYLGTAIITQYGSTVYIGIAMGGPAL